MPTIERCLALIHQADGTIEEKFECASMGLWGNVPTYQTAMYAPQPNYDSAGYVQYSAAEAEDQLSGGNREVNCKTCNCGGGGAAAAAGGGGGSLDGAAFGIGLPGFGSIGVSVSALLVAIILGVLVAKKG